MKIQKLKINGFGKLQDKELNFSDGLNVIYGSNESGKSTLHEFINSMFFGAAKTKKGKDESILSKYTPWNANDYSR